MELKNILFVVEDMKGSKEFYCRVFGLEVLMDFGENITLTGGISLQSKASFAKFIEKTENEIKYQGNDAELYFEEEDFDAFIARLKSFDGIKYLHDVKEHDWGQRVIRIYDLDCHIIEVGESMKTVCRRFLSQGLSVEETAKKTQFPIAFVIGCLV